MSYRTDLPQLDGRPFLTDGGIETTLIFHHGLDLPEFAAFDLLKDEAGTDELRRYYAPFAHLARDRGIGFVLESPTWRANPAWAAKVGYDLPALDAANRRAIALMEELRERYETPEAPFVISGCVGPHDDGYEPGAILTADEAQAYHSVQVETFADTAADMVTAITMTYADEAIGVVRAAAAAGMPVVASLTVETDGRLPSGQPLGQAIEEIDAATGAAAAYFMVNCAHPSHFADELSGGAWLERIRGVRANASTMSHAELDEAEELDAGDPAEFAGAHAPLAERLPRLSVVGGCCGTDHRHVTRLCDALVAPATA